MAFTSSSCMGHGGGPGRCLCEQVADFGIAGLLKVLVPQADGIERLWGRGTHDLVRHRFQLMAHGTGSDRNGNDNAGRLLLTQGQNGSTHASAGRQAVIDQDDRASMHVKRWSATTIVQGTPLQFLLLLGRYG